MKNLEHLIGAYFHQDWNHVYSSREEAVADFVRRSPDRAPAVPDEIDELLRSSDDDLAGRLESMGFDDAPPDGDRAFLVELRAHLVSLSSPS